ncbi:MAG: hypothetical protein EP326_00045 [Deltaproteobacteria bacterium]|nr:MAG: hypothetical protein EP326_00045 [Deltaproteobacteria bacterium]
MKQLKNGHFGNESLYTFDHNYSSLLTICDALQETPIENLVYADVNGYNNAFVSTITEVQIIPFDNLKKVSYSKPNVSYSIIVNCNEKELENLLANTKLMLKKELITSDGHRLYVVSLGE